MGHKSHERTSLDPSGNPTSIAKPDDSALRLSPGKPDSGLLSFGRHGPIQGKNFRSQEGFEMNNVGMSTMTDFYSAMY